MPDQVIRKCGNCACFLHVDPTTGKGRCRFFPPAVIPEREASRDDPEGKRWPLCWADEWCRQWEHR